FSAGPSGSVALGTSRSDIASPSASMDAASNERAEGAGTAFQSQHAPTLVLNDLLMLKLETVRNNLGLSMRVDSNATGDSDGGAHAANVIPFEESHNSGKLLSIQ